MKQKQQKKQKQGTQRKKVKRQVQEVQTGKAKKSSKMVQNTTGENGKCVQQNFLNTFASKHPFLLRIIIAIAVLSVQGIATICVKSEVWFYVISLIDALAVIILLYSFSYSNE